MTTTILPRTAPATESVTRQRMGLMAIVLSLSALAAIPGGVLWPEPSGGGETYAYADIADQRDLWWGLLTSLAIVAMLGVILQAFAVLYLVRERGSRWATAGGLLMFVGIVAQGVGVAGWATAYFFPTDPALDPAAGQAVFESVNDNIGYIFAVLMTGAALAVLGQVFQAVALLRAKVVPTWVPIASLFTIITFVVPGNGLVGLVTSLPMTAAAIALGWLAYRRAAS